MTNLTFDLLAIWTLTLLTITVPTVNVFWHSYKPSSSSPFLFFRLILWKYNDPFWFTEILLESGVTTSPSLNQVNLTSELLIHDKVGSEQFNRSGEFFCTTTTWGLLPVASLLGMMLVAGIKLKKINIFTHVIFVLLHLQTVSPCFKFPLTQLFLMKYIWDTGFGPVLNSPDHNEGERGGIKRGWILSVYSITYWI